MDEAVVRAFHRTARLGRDDIFSGEALTPIVALEDANTAAPGWVGDHWRQGTVLIGINPGGGGDAYRRNSTDDQLYALLREFRDADPASRSIAFTKVSDAWRSIQKTHSIWRVISAVLEAVGESEREVGFMNVVPFRTRTDKMPARAESQLPGSLRQNPSWKHSTRSA